VANIIDGDIGYVVLSEFTPQTGEQMLESVKNLVKQGIRGLIIDERNNSGGAVDGALQVANIFLPANKTLVTIQGKKGSNRDQRYISTGSSLVPKDLPIVLLTNGGSASSSEILAAALKEDIIKKDTRSGVNYWRINFDNPALLKYFIEILTNMPEHERVPFFLSQYAQEMVLKIAGFFAMTNRPNTRTGYEKTNLSEYWGFLHGEQIASADDDELSEETLSCVEFYQWVVTHSPSFFLYYKDPSQIDPYLKSVLSSCLYKTEWKDFDFLYFVGTMGLIVDYSRSDEKYQGEVAAFLTKNMGDISCHISLKNPDRLFHNMIQAQKGMLERHDMRSGEGFSQKSFRWESNMFQKVY